MSAPGGGAFHGSNNGLNGSGASSGSLAASAQLPGPFTPLSRASRFLAGSVRALFFFFWFFVCFVCFGFLIGVFVLLVLFVFHLHFCGFHLDFCLCFYSL